MPSIDLGKLVQASISKQIQENTDYSASSNEINFEGVADSLGRAYRKVTGNETFGDKAYHLGNKVKDAASDLGSKARNAASDLGSKARNAASDLGNRASDISSEIKDKTIQGASKIGKMIQDDPALAAGGIAAGAGLLGAGYAARKYFSRKKRR